MAVSYISVPRLLIPEDGQIRILKTPVTTGLRNNIPGDWELQHTVRTSNLPKKYFLLQAQDLGTLSHISRPLLPAMILPTATTRAMKTMTIMPMPPTPFPSILTVTNVPRPLTPRVTFVASTPTKAKLAEVTA